MSEPIPDRPRLKPHVALVPFPPENLILKGPNLFARFSGEGVGIVMALAPHLDGTHDLAALATKSGQSEEDVRDILEALAEDHAIEDASHDAALTDVDRARFAPQLRALSDFTRNAPAALARLRAARVAIAGDGRLADALAPLLEAAGIGTVTRASFASPDLRLVTDDEWARVVASCDHVVLATDTPVSSAFLRLNDAAIAAGRMWTGAFHDAHEAIVGPTVIPQETACWRCYDLRVKGAHPNMDRLMAYEGARESRGLLTPPAAFAGFASIAAGFAADAVMHAIARVTLPPLAGRVLRVEFDEFRAERHRVLRIPRCPACTGANVPDVDRYALEPVTLS